MAYGTNTLNNVNGAGGIIAKAAAKMLSDELHFTKSIAKADPEDYKGKNGYGAGETIYISKPARFIAQQAFDITSTQQAITEERVPLTLNIISTIGLNIDTLEFATELQLKNILERVIKPATETIGHDVENRMLLQACNAVANTTGTAGSTVFDTNQVLSAKTIMNKYLAPKVEKDRFLLLESFAGQSAVNARKGLFNDRELLGKQYKTGVVGRADGLTWLESEMLPTHTRGTATGTITVTTTSTEGATTLALTGTGAQTLLVGDVLTIANVHSVHPITKTVYPFLMQFVVTANNTASSGAFTGVAVQTANGDAMYTATSTSLQNIDALPQGGAAVTLVGAASTGYIQNLAFHKNAFRMVSVPLIMPKMVEFAEQETYNGITVAIIRAFDPLKRAMVTRLDFLGGIVADRPEWACKITA